MNTGINRMVRELHRQHKEFIALSAWSLRWHFSKLDKILYHAQRDAKTIEVRLAQLYQYSPDMHQAYRASKADKAPAWGGKVIALHPDDWNAIMSEEEDETAPTPAMQRALKRDLITQLVLLPHLINRHQVPQRVHHVAVWNALHFKSLYQ